MAIKHDLNPALKAALTASGIRYEEVDAFALTSIKSHLQVRHDTTGDGDMKYNAAKVREYANRFKSGSNCPPIGITRDGVLVWGNHRSEGARKAEMSDVPAIVLNVDGADPDEHMLATLMTLSGRENSEHGLPLSNKDREMIVRKEIALGTTSGAIQQAYGMTSAQVSGLKRQIDAENRLSDLGLRSRADGAGRSILSSFSGPNARALTNPPFKALVELALDAELTATEVNALSMEARASGTEDGALQVIATKRSELEKQIAEVATAGRMRPTPLSRLRKATTEIAGLCAKHDASAYRDYTDESVHTRATIESAIKCLQDILAAQDA